MIKYQLSHLALFLLVILIANSCRYTKKIRHIENIKGCNNAISFINKNWDYKENKKIYKISDVFFEKFTINGDYHHCLDGLTRNEIKILLGKPNESLSKSLRYYNDTQCHNKNVISYYCSGTSIEFNDKGKVNNIDFIGWSSIN